MRNALNKILKVVEKALAAILSEQLIHVTIAVMNAAPVTTSAVVDIIAVGAALVAVITLRSWIAE